MEQCITVEILKIDTNKINVDEVLEIVMYMIDEQLEIAYNENDN